MNKEIYHVIGIMSGTSLDGIDLAEIVFNISDDKKWSFEIITSETISYPSQWKQKLREAISFSEKQLDLLNREYTVHLSGVITNFIEKHKIEKLNAVCSHGHTILHRPENGLTLQIGNLPELAKLIGQTVVCDFRVQDVALGGQGAPLVPIGDRLLFDEYDYCINLGGFGNMSFDKDGLRIAYDICPVNIVLNIYAENLGLPYDDRGKIAASGVLDGSLLEKLNSLNYYTIRPPKSLGLEWVQKNILPILEASTLSIEDKLRSFTEHIAMQIGNQFRKDALVLVTGGGAYNDFLISRIHSYKGLNIVLPSADLIGYKEALIFAMLGVLRLRGEINCLASVTGANRDHSSGKIFFP